ncbi:Imm21 family immunity protein [Kitasatospora sp. SUK 42]|uniref:Imm21 family immunity protein n=1 Tax=Kitasatospora sp. SUK 42 TaxID=1588882 RepID=UPI0018CB410D|nr:Imm21 family immunity protein [Kitasatospora sp. SUK 42]MBV2155208.1 immunity 21 family protein [Kitasatospora sp. SUK 42]
MTQVELNWLDGTDSGRYVVCPERAVESWTYERVEELLDQHIDEYATAFPVDGHGDVLVLAGEPLPIAWLAEERVFVRPVHCPCSDAVRPLVREALRSGVWQDGPTVELTAGRYLLTDAAYDGEEMLPQGRHLAVELARGRYLVQSLVDSAPEAPFYLERLLPAR